jgi:dTDP-4-amino-4,6-dideoxygalactose transaminase
MYRDYLRDIPEITLPWPEVDPGTAPAYHIFPVLIPKEADRAQFMNFMRENGVQTSIHYPFPGEMTHHRKYINDDVPVAREISSRVVTLPLYPGMKSEDVGYVASKVKEYWGVR